ncbi:MAG TPA: phosphotransferase, partial [Longimicrobiales bacterium]
MASSSADGSREADGAAKRWPLEHVARVARDVWGLEGRLEALPGERDWNALLTAEDGARWVVKVAAADDTEEILSAQDRVLEILARDGRPFAFPEPLAAPDRSTVARVEREGEVRLVRVLRYVAGTPLAAVRPHSPELLASMGELLGTVSRALDGVDEPAAHRELSWDLRRGFESAVADLAHVPVEGGRRARLEALLEHYRRQVEPVADDLRRGLAHGDGNDHNVLVSPIGDDPLEPRRATGLIDFGDLIHTWVCAEPAIGAAYAMLGKRAPLDAAIHFVRGYASRFPLTGMEADVLFPLVCLRLAVSVARSAGRRARGEDDAYLFVSEAPAWALLDRLGPVPPDLARYRIREACGLEPCPSSAVVRGWLAAHEDEVGPVLDPDPAKARRVTLDLSVGSLDLGGLRGREDAAAWTEVIRTLMEEEGAEVGVGLWDEARRWYQGDLYRVETDDGPAWRSVHIGVDLFVPPGTPVLAPLPGSVASVAMNAGHLDYGPTVILRHRAGPVDFHTLYGHLSTETLDHVEAGQRVNRGDVLGWIGHSGENGGWAPHLHLQIVPDLMGHQRQFPGVALPGQRALWRALSPDPNLLLRLPEGCAARPPPGTDELLERRRRGVG